MDDSEIPWTTLNINDPQIRVIDPEAQCNELIGNEQVDKQTAIQIYKMYTTMLIDNQRSERRNQHEIECLRHEMEVLKLSTKDQETLLDNSSRLRAVEERVTAIEENARQYKSAMDDIRSRLADVEARLPTKKRYHLG